MLKKFAVIIVLFFTFLVSVDFSDAAIDASSNIPALNPFCWKKKDCIEARRGFVKGNPTD